MNYFSNDIARNIAFTVGATIVDPADLSIFDMHHYVSAMSKSQVDSHLAVLAEAIEGRHQDDVLWSKRNVYVNRLIAKKIILARLNYMLDKDYVWGNDVVSQMSCKCPDFGLYSHFSKDDDEDNNVGTALSNIEKETYFKGTYKDYFKKNILKEGNFNKFFEDIAPLPEAGRYGCITLLIARVIIPWMLYEGDKAVKEVEKLLLSKDNPDYKKSTDFMLLLYQLESFITQANSLNLHFSEELVVLWNNVLGYMITESNSMQENKHEEFTFTFAVFCCIPYPFNYLHYAVNYTIEILVRDTIHRVEIAKDLLAKNEDMRGNKLYETESDIDINILFVVDDIVETILTSSTFERERFVDAVFITDIEGQIDKADMENLKESSDDTVSGNFDVTISFEE